MTAAPFEALANGRVTLHCGDMIDVLKTLPENWDGWGTALKPALEPICFARKPLSEKTIAKNVLAHGTGGLNVDGCRVGDTKDVPASTSTKSQWFGSNGESGIESGHNPNIGRWPANVLTDGSAEVVEMFPETGLSSGGKGEASQDFTSKNGIYGKFGKQQRANAGGLGDSGSAARFFYSAKADADDRLGSKHPTVKPVDLMQWLVRLVTPPGGVVLDCFAGTGTTGEAAFREGFNAILIEREAEYQADIRRRMALVLGGPDERRRESIKAGGNVDMDPGPLFR